MKIDGNYTIHASRERVFALLVGEDVLRRCVPGCRRLVREGDDRFAATLEIGLGSVQGTYEGIVALRKKFPPEQLEMQIDGKGKLGFVRGTGSVRLEKVGEPELTRVFYHGDLQIGGSIAGVGQRMIQGAAKMVAGQFFAAIEAEANSAQSEASAPIKHGPVRTFLRWLRSTLRGLFSRTAGSP